MSEYTPEEKKLLSYCVSRSLEMAERNCTPEMKRAYANEPKTLKSISKSEALVPKLKALLKKLKAKS